MNKKCLTPDCNYMVVGDWCSKCGAVQGRLFLEQKLATARAALKDIDINLGIPLSEKERPSYEVCIAAHKKAAEALKAIGEV